MTDWQLEVIIILVALSSLAHPHTHTHKSEQTVETFVCVKTGSDYCKGIISWIIFNQKTGAKVHLEALLVCSHVKIACNTWGMTLYIRHVEQQQLIKLYCTLIFRSSIQYCMQCCSVIGFCFSVYSIFY